MESFALLAAHGIQPEQYWEMTWAEICAVTKAISDKQRRDDQISAMVAWKSADLIGQNIAAILGGKRKPESLEQAFKGLFNESTEEFCDIKARMMRNMQKINAGKRGGENAG